MQKNLSELTPGDRFADSFGVEVVVQKNVTLPHTLLLREFFYLTVESTVTGNTRTDRFEKGSILDSKVTLTA